MELESEKYLVTTDGKQFILQMKEVVKDSSMLKDKIKIGSIKLGSKSYYSTLPMLFNGMVKHSLLTNDEIQSFEDIKNEIEDIRNALMGCVERGEQCD
jgi:hypothetical protein